MSGGHVMTVYAQCISLWQEGSWLRRLAPPEERHCFYGVTLCSTRKTMALLECSMIAWNAQRLALINEAASENYPHCGYACILLDQNTKICMCFSSCACFFFNLKDQLQKKKLRSYSQIRRWPQIPDYTGRLSHFTELLPVVSCLHSTLYSVSGLVINFLYTLWEDLGTDHEKIHLWNK